MKFKEICLGNLVIRFKIDVPYFILRKIIKNFKLLFNALNLGRYFSWWQYQNFPQLYSDLKFPFSWKIEIGKKKKTCYEDIKTGF